MANAYGELQVRGPSVIATTESVEGQDSYVTEIYYWDTKSESLTSWRMPTLPILDCVSM